jgi:hypothetical protein
MLCVKPFHSKKANLERVKRVASRRADFPFTTPKSNFGSYEKNDINLLFTLSGIFNFRQR